MTELIDATKANNFDLVQTLVQDGADIDFPDDNGTTALMFAAYIGSVELVQFLSQSGANLDLHNIHNYTALTFAVSAGHHNKVDILVQAGVQLNIQCNFGFSALAIAAQAGYFEIAQILVRAGATLDLKTDICDKTMLLLQSVAPIKDISGKSARDLASDEGHHQIVQLIDDEVVIRSRVKFLTPIKHIQTHQLTAPEPYQSLIRLPEHLFRQVILFYN